MTRWWNALKPWLIFLAPSLVLGGFIGLLPGYKAYHYAWYDERFCTTCHVHDYATVGWAASVHGRYTTCHDCHHQRLRDYIREAYVMMTKRPTFPQDLHHTPYVNKELCAACHLSKDFDRSTITGPMKHEEIENIPKVDQERLHALHLEKQTDLTLLNSHLLTEPERDGINPQPMTVLPLTKGEPRPITCADCHGGPTNRGHNFSAVDVSCVRCHQESHRTKVGKQYGCRSCHFAEFMIRSNKKDSK